MNGIISADWEEEAGQVGYVARLPLHTPQSRFTFLRNKTSVFGQYAFVDKIDETTFEAIRDPLGISKLFYTETEDGQIVFSERFDDLFRFQSKIYAVPAGKHVRIGAGGVRQLIKDLRISEQTQSASADVAATAAISSLQEKAQRRFEMVFGAIRELEKAGWRVFVALSGGLDSAGIAHAAAQHLATPIACTLNLGQSEDADKSAIIAQKIGIRHIVFDTDREAILQAVHAAPPLCQDFRDFNVHCAALNLLLAEHIRTWDQARQNGQDSRILVLTGDLMNEYTCDYAEEIVEGKKYYRLPRTGTKALQKYLIRGIDTSDRELLPFAHYGIDCIQPYAALYDLYEALPEAALEKENAKQALNRFFVPSAIHDDFPKNKLRAQVGSRENMGILGICHQEGITDRHFKQRLIEQADGAPEQIPIFVGQYDTEAFVAP